MNKSKLEILDISPSQVQAGSFTMVLAEENGDLRLPIIIGMFEAQAIAIELEKIKSKRPLTHDLFSSFAQAFDFTIEEIVITDIDEGVFYAKIICSDGIRQKNIDARPSDAIAIALRFNVPIYTVQKVLDEAGVSTSDLLGETPEEEKRSKKFSVKVSDKKKSKSLSDLNISELQKSLQEALEKEDYEKAAKLRDELERRN
ncbi:MAG: bifunctional nuclease family protein [Cytophagales bacterium]|nr:bifunctional nuclease family protein [Cytophagales bacterium]